MRKDQRAIARSGCGLGRARARPHRLLRLSPVHTFRSRRGWSPSMLTVTAARGRVRGHVDPPLQLPPELADRW